MNLQTRVTNILSKPKDEWPVIAAETTDVAALFTSYIVLLAAIPPICSFIRTALFGLGIPFLRIGGSIVGYGLTSAILGYVLSLVGVYVSALIIEKLAPTFQSQGDTTQALKLVAYAYTPVWVLGVLNLIPFLGALAALVGGLYAIYLFYLGVTPVMKTPADKVIPYMVVSAIVIIVVWFVISMITGAVVAAIFMRSMLG